MQIQGLRIAIGDRLLCRRLDLDIRAGQCWGLLGRNGSGKTTLLHTLTGLRPAQGGQVRFEGRALDAWPRRELARGLGLLLQDRESRFPMSVEDTVLCGRYPHLGPWSSPGKQDRQLAQQALEKVGLAGLARRNIQTLSGGERQRVALAALLAQAPRLLLLDEPVSHLDLREQVRLLDLLQALTQAGHAVIMSLHDLNHALAYCDHLLLLRQGRAIAGEARRIAGTERLSRLYGLPLSSVAGPRGTLMAPR